MLTIRRAILDSVIEHAYSAHPDISCGFVAGPEGTDRPERHIPMRNAEVARNLWSFDTLESVRVFREMDARGEEPVVVYHSQDLPDPEISRRTLSFAIGPQVHYLVISTSYPEVPLYRSYRVVDGRAVEDEITVVDEVTDTVEDEIPDSTP